MENYKKRIIAGSVALSIVIIAAAGWIARGRNISPSYANVEPAAERIVAKSELERSDGREGRECLVAVDGVVYRIEGFGLWQDGQHSTSNGQAYCGADMTDAIGKSPHGRKKLDQLEKIGRLES